MVFKEIYIISYKSIYISIFLIVHAGSGTQPLFKWLFRLRTWPLGVDFFPARRPVAQWQNTLTFPNFQTQRPDHSVVDHFVVDFSRLSGLTTQSVFLIPAQRPGAQGIIIHIVNIVFISNKFWKVIIISNKYTYKTINKHSKLCYFTVLDHRRFWHETLLFK